MATATKPKRAKKTKKRETKQQKLERIYARVSSAKVPPVHSYQAKYLGLRGVHASDVALLGLTTAAVIAAVTASLAG